MSMFAKAPYQKKGVHTAQLSRSKQSTHHVPSASSSHPPKQTQSGSAVRQEHSFSHIPVFSQESAKDAESDNRQLSQRIQAHRGRGSLLDIRSRNTLARSIPLDTSGIRVHTDAESDRLSQSVKAIAFTVGNDIFFRSGMYRPESKQGMHLLAHEVAHVAQQAAGPVTGIPTGDGISISDPQDRFEQAATSIAKAVIASSNIRHPQPVLQVPRVISQSLPAAMAPASHITIQRSIGLEMELRVPVDKYGLFTTEEEGLLAKKNPDRQEQEKIRRIKKQAAVKYKQPIMEGKGFKAVADKGKEIGALSMLNPPQTLAPSIIELVTYPAVSKQKALQNAINACVNYCTELNRLTQGLTRRAAIGNGFYAGPINNQGQKPANLGFQAGIQVNLGIDPRKFHRLLAGYLTTPYEPGKSTLNPKYGEVKRSVIQIALEVGKFYADQLRQQSTPDQRAQAHNFDGIGSLTTALALYLRGGNYEGEISIVKNFSPLLFKTRLAYAFNDLTDEERQVLEQHWDEFQAYLLERTRGNTVKKLDPKQLLIKSLLPSGSPASSRSVKYLFESLRDSSIAPVALGDSSEIQPDPIGSTRSIKDGTLPKDDDGTSLMKKRRRALVSEFRAIPGTYLPEEWFKLGSSFLTLAERLNMGEP